MDKGWYALVIMLANNRLDRFRARHGGFLAHESSYSPEPEASDLRHLPEQRWPHTMLELQLVHDAQVLLLLVPHFLAVDECEVRGYRKGTGHT